MVVKRCNLYLGVVGGCVDYDGPDAIYAFTLHQLCFFKLRIDTRGRQQAAHYSSSCSTLSCAEMHDNLSNRKSRMAIFLGISLSHTHRRLKEEEMNVRREAGTKEGDKASSNFACIPWHEWIGMISPPKCRPLKDWGAPGKKGHFLKRHEPRKKGASEIMRV